MHLNINTKYKHIHLNTTFYNNQFRGENYA